MAPTLRHIREELSPYVLARVSADRVEETQTKRDAAKLRELVFGIEPVTNIQLGCESDGRELPTRAIVREAFVYQDEVLGKMVSFVQWGEGVWPPAEDDAEALATAFGEVLGAGYFESFLALIRAPSDVKRDRLLKRAGAPTDIEERQCCSRMAMSTTPCRCKRRWGPSHRTQVIGRFGADSGDELE